MSRPCEDRRRHAARTAHRRATPAVASSHCLPPRTEGAFASHDARPLKCREACAHAGSNGTQTPCESMAALAPAGAAHRARAPRRSLRRRDDPPAATATPAATMRRRHRARGDAHGDSRRRLPTDHRGLRRDRGDAGGGARADHLLLARRNRDPLRHRGRGACRRDRRVLRLPRRDGGAAEARLLQPRAGGRPRTRAGPAAHGHAAARAGRAVPQPRDDGAVPRLGAGPRRRVLDDRPARRGHRQPPAGCRPDRVDARADRGGDGSPRRMSRRGRSSSSS